MVRWGILILLLSVVTPALATEPVNYCHKPEVNAQWEKLLSRTPRDPIVIRLYALQEGLCGMVDP